MKTFIFKATHPSPEYNGIERSLGVFFESFTQTYAADHPALGMGHTHDTAEAAIRDLLGSNGFSNISDIHEVSGVAS